MAELIIEEQKTICEKKKINKEYTYTSLKSLKNSGSLNTITFNIVTFK